MRDADVDLHAVPQRAAIEHTTCYILCTLAMKQHSFPYIACVKS